jgi:hypothetical protein
MEMKKEEGLEDGFMHSFFTNPDSILMTKRTQEAEKNTRKFTNGDSIDFEREDNPELLKDEIRRLKQMLKQRDIEI